MTKIKMRKFVILCIFMQLLSLTNQSSSKIMIDYIKNFKSVDHNKIFIKNRDEVNNKIHNFIRGGFESLSVISDYDLTITKQHVDGKSQLHAYAILQRCPSVPPEVNKIVTEITQKYKDFSKDLSISQSQRNILMSEWWMKTIEAYKGLKISPEEMVNATLKYGPPARDNAKEFFDILSKENVPVLLVSAGLSQFLEPLLKQMGITSPNIEMLANQIKLDEEGRIDGYEAPPIHTENKNSVDLKKSKLYPKIENRHNFLTMGDHLGDAKIAGNLENIENILKIGFFYGEAESVLPTWLNTFDIVLKDDQTMNVPIAILELLS